MKAKTRCDIRETSISSLKTGRSRVLSSFRFYLSRQFKQAAAGETLSTTLFVMLNPSTADDTNNDPTIRRCISFAQREQTDQLVVVNLFAYRATKPSNLRLAGYPIGDDNDEWIVEAAKAADRIICAWGALSTPEIDARAAHVYNLLTTPPETQADHVPVYCLGLTQGGQPRHPLFAPGNTVLVRYAGPGEPQ